MVNRLLRVVAVLGSVAMIYPITSISTVAYAAPNIQMHLANSSTVIGPDGLPVPVGSGTLTMVIPDTSYRGANSPKQGKITLTDIWCEYNNSGSGTVVPTLGINGWNGGISFQAFFTAKSTTLHLATQAANLTGGPVSTFEDHSASGQLEKFPTHVAGTVNLMLLLAKAGSLTVDISCVRTNVAGVTTAPIAAAPSSKVPNTSTKKGSSPLIPILVIVGLVVAAAAVVLKMKAKRPPDWTDGITDDPEGIMPDPYSHENWMRIFKGVASHPIHEESNEGFNPVPPASTPTSDDPTDREEIG